MDILFEKGKHQAILIRSKCPKQDFFFCQYFLQIEEESQIETQNWTVSEAAHLTTFSTFY